MSEITNTPFIKQAIQIISTLNAVRPHKSLSFTLDQDGLDALIQTLSLVEEKFPKNMTNMRSAAIDTLTPLSIENPNTPLNVNLTEEDIKSLEKVQEILERELG